MNKAFPIRLLNLLLDRQIHSGEFLGRSLGVTRAAIWKQLQGLQEFGLKVQSLKGMGYQLAENIDLLDGKFISNTLLVKHNIHCDVFIQIDSTNSMLMRLLNEKNVPSGRCIVAEIQTEGRGRRGRKWVSPFAKNLSFSMLWSFDNGLSGLEGLSLVIGISIAQVLKKMGLDEVRIKWPNDVFINNRKLAGILLEVSGDPTGFCQVVMGIGLNVYMRSEKDLAIDQPWISLDELIDLRINRSTLFISIIEKLIENLRIYEKYGFAYFMDEWSNYDTLRDKEVIVSWGGNVTIGIAQGVSSSGELLVATQSAMQVFNGGEVSLRFRQ